MNESKHGIFLRLECYAHHASRLKLDQNTISAVVSEALRHEGFCDHVASPLPPQIVYGDSPANMLAELQAIADTRFTTYFHKPSGTFKVRKERSDKAVAVCGVISVPPEWRESLHRWKLFKEACVKFLINEFGASRLKSVLEHVDEKCLHLHFFVCPELDEPLWKVHPGRRASHELPTYSAPREKKLAFRVSMSSLLTRFYERVGKRFGLVRSHLGARRMSRRDIHIFKWSRKRRLIDQQKITARPVPPKKDMVLPFVPVNFNPWKPKIHGFGGLADNQALSVPEGNTSQILIPSKGQHALQIESKLELPFVPAEINLWKAKTRNVVPLQDSQALGLHKAYDSPNNSFSETKPPLAKSSNRTLPVDEFPPSLCNDTDDFDCAPLDEIFATVSAPRIRG
jgi:hypothetical protein